MLRIHLSRRDNDSKLSPLAGNPRPCRADVGGGQSASGAQAQSLRYGMIVDATHIAVPSSTKNADRARDPEMY
jgi:hypothetical protein